MKSGADLGWGRFSKSFENFVDLFFKSTKLIFRALTNHFKDSILTKLSEPQAKIFLKKAKNGVFRHFLKNVDQKIAFFRRALPPPPKLV